MGGHAKWSDIRADDIARAGGEEAFEAGKRDLLAQVVGHRLAEVRRARGLTQQQVAERMGVTKGRVSQIEQGEVAGQNVVDRYAAALSGRLYQVIYFDDGDIAATHRPACVKVNHGVEPFVALRRSQSYSSRRCPGSSEARM